MAAEKLIKRLYGYSYSEILLMEDESGRHFVRKKGAGWSRNVDKLDELHKLGIRVPEIYSRKEDSFDMEYIHGMDIKTYLMRYPVGNLIDYLTKILLMVKSIKGYTKDYDYIYQNKLGFLTDDWEYYKDKIPFTPERFAISVPCLLESSAYIGDLTLDNILFDGREFVLIDPVTIEYDSYIFDIAKLNQDLTCGWFLRNDNYRNFEEKLKQIRDGINPLLEYEDSVKNHFIILMLLRVLPYARVKSKQDEQWIYDRIKTLWSK